MVCINIGILILKFLIENIVFIVNWVIIEEKDNIDVLIWLYFIDVVLDYCKIYFGDVVVKEENCV